MHIEYSWRYRYSRYVHVVCISNMYSYRGVSSQQILLYSQHCAAYPIVGLLTPWNTPTTDEKTLHFVDLFVDVEISRC